MLNSSSLIEYSSVIELIIEQLDLIKLIFEKNYSNLSQIDSWVHETANSSSKTDISDNLFYEKIKKYKFYLHKKLILNQEKTDDFEENYFPLFSFYKKRQFWKSVQTDIDAELLVAKTLLKFPINNPLDSIEVQDENGEMIRFGNSTVMLLKSMDLFNEYSFIINLEQKSYLDLILLTKLLDELKREISNQGSYEIFYNNLIIFKLQSTITTKIVNDLKNNSKNVRFLKSKINLTKNQAKYELNNMKLSKRNLVAKKSRLLFQNKILTNYLKKWKKKKFSTIQMINIGEFKKIEKSIESIKSSMQIENQAHDLMILALNKEILSYVNKFNELEECYNSSIEKFQIKLDKIKSQCDLQKEKIRNLKDDYDYKLNIVLNYREEKTEEENFIKASKLISNWWLMVQFRIRRLKLR